MHFGNAFFHKLLEKYLILININISQIIKPMNMIKTDRYIFIINILWHLIIMWNSKCILAMYSFISYFILILNITTSNIVKITNKIKTNSRHHVNLHIECKSLTLGALLGFQTLAKLMTRYCSNDIKFEVATQPNSKNWKYLLTPISNCWSQPHSVFWWAHGEGG